MKQKNIAIAGLAITVAAVSAAYANNLNTGGLSGVNNTYTAYSIGRGSYELGLSFKGEYGHEALHEFLPGGAVELKDVVLLSQDLFLAYGLTNWMDVAADLPVYQDRIDGFDDFTAGIGDLGLSVKIMHPGMKTDALLRLAYVLRATLPTGNFDQGYFARDPMFAHVSQTNLGGAFTSDGFNLNPSLAWTLDFTRLRAPKPWLIHLNLGVDALLYPDQKENIPQENSSMKAGLAVEWLASRDWSVYLDFYGKSRIANITDGPFLEIFAKDRLVLALGTQGRFKSGLTAALAVEGGLSTQENFTRWSLVSEGEVRDYGIQPTPIVGATVTLGFGRTGTKADSDFDRNPNATDKCPQDAEDYDGYEDEDGCPDPVHKPAAAERVTDTVIVVQRDTVQVTRTDTVRVTVQDTLQFRAGQDPNREMAFGQVTFPAVQFRLGSDELSRTSFKTLNDIAQSLKNFPGVKLQVIGHTDNTGSDATNAALSQKRAQAVVTYLVSQGIDASRLEAIGKGASLPVEPNTTAAVRLKNRRVEFKRVQ